MIDQRVELEVDLVVARGEVRGQAIAVVPPLEAVDESLRQAELQQIGRAGVEPLGRKGKVPGYAVTGGLKRCRQRLGAAQLIASPQRENVDIPRRPFNKSESQQTRS